MSHLSALCTNDKTPLHIAIEEGQTEAIKVLLEQKESQCLQMIKEKTKFGETVLHLACKSFKIETVNSDIDDSYYNQELNSENMKVEFLVK